jgi:xanthine dehydrogenase/oxidase
LTNDFFAFNLTLINRHYSVNACLIPVLATDGCHVTTIEGIGSVKGDNLHPVQQAMVDLHGSQCGFCTPGIIVSIYTLLTNNPTVASLEEHLDGNLCRCTGYRPIWDAARSLCVDGVEAVKGPCGVHCRECSDRESCTNECNVNVCTTSSEDKMSLYKDTYLRDGSWREQPNKMFPVELLNDLSTENVLLKKPLMIVDTTEGHSGGTWFKPTTLMEMLILLHDFGSSDGFCKIIVGNTEVGIEQKFKHAIHPRLLYPSETITELFSFEATDSQLLIGSCCSLSKVQDTCQFLSAKTDFSRTVMPIHDMLRWFASTQIRNVACLGGNLVTASPISDMNPMLASMRAKLILSSTLDNRTVSRRSVLVADFFLQYRTVDLSPTEVVERIEVPLLRPIFEYLHPFKQARRREDDISIVTSGMRIRLRLRDGKYLIDDVAIAFGGMAPTTVMAVETTKVLQGAEFSASTFEQATAALIEEMKLSESVPGGQAAYRTTLAISFLHKFYLSCVADLEADIAKVKANPEAYPGLSDLPAAPAVSIAEQSGAFNFLREKKPSFSGVQSYPTPKVATGLEGDILPKVQYMAAAEAASVGQPMTHQSGPLHCTGEALYTDDIPLPPGTLHACLVLSSQCGCVYEGIDTTAALAIPSVHGIYTHDDLLFVGGINTLGPVIPDEVVFLPVGEIIKTVGQVIGIVVAETLEAAELAARTVTIQHSEQREQIIVTMEDAIEAESFFDMARHSMLAGDLSILDALASTPDTNGEPKVGDIVKISGEFHSGSQEHFYLEPNTTLAVPSESDTCMTIYASTQATSKTQMCVASSVGMKASRVVCRVKRMGGGFGGKETRSVWASCAAAVAAKRSCRPVRLTLPRDVDMQCTGQRHAFYSKYSCSAKITNDGAQLIALDLVLYSNGGWALDLSGAVMDRALFHVDNCYKFPNFRCEGIPCKTAQAPHTAFRGFGGPQGMAVTEHIMGHLSIVCGVPGDKLRRMNMYKVGDAVPFGMIIGQNAGKWNVPIMYDRLYDELDVAQRRRDIDEFNVKHKWIKRGLSLTPTKFGIAYTAKFMNQGGALVHLYTDGTVLVSHGGTEMGQGLHTKVCQVAAQAFGISIDDVYVNDSSTDKVANTIPTAASMSTDT